MNELFAGRDSNEYQNALESYTNAITKEATDQASLNRDADEYNETLTGVTDPIGLLVGGKPVETLVQKGLSKALGKTVPKISELPGKAINFVKGKLLNKVQEERGIKPQDLTKVDPEDLVSLPKATSADEPGAPQPAAQPAPEPEAPAVEPGAPGPGPATSTTTIEQLPVEKSAFDPDDPFSPPRTLFREKATISQEAGNPAAAEGTDSTLSTAAEGAAGGEELEQGAARTGATLVKSIAKKAASKVVTKLGGSATEDVIAGIGEGIDASAAAEGGANPIADVLAGAVGLATLLGGIFGEKKAKEAPEPQFIPSAQFGV